MLKYLPPLLLRCAVCSLLSRFLLLNFYINGQRCIRSHSCDIQQTARSSSVLSKRKTAKTKKLKWKGKQNRRQNGLWPIREQRGKKTPNANHKVTICGWCIFRLSFFIDKKFLRIHFFLSAFIFWDEVFFLCFTQPIASILTLIIIVRIIIRVFVNFCKEEIHFLLLFFFIHSDSLYFSAFILISIFAFCLRDSLSSSSPLVEIK